MTNQRTVTINAGEQTIAFSREFEAPAARVFEAHTDATSWSNGSDRAVRS